MFGFLRRGHASQTAREIERAEILVADLLGLSRHGASAALNDQAVATGISVHAAALAVVADAAASTPLLDRTSH